MSSTASDVLDILGIIAVFLLVGANGFFVASEFSLVAVRRSRVAELVGEGRANAKMLQSAVDRLDANLAATQFGITISSLALGWIGEPALASLIEPALFILPHDWAIAGSHAISVAIAFIVITALHIVLGELAPKSLALQRSEGTALAIVRPLALFLFLFRPAILSLNALGNFVLRLFGLRPGAGEASLHSAEELKLLVRESQQAGIIEETQREVVVRALNIGDRSVGDIMTPRPEVEWVDANDPKEKVLQKIRESRFEQLLVGRGDIDEPQGMVLKRDLLEQAFEGKKLDPLAVMRPLTVVHEAMTVFRVLDQFKRAPTPMIVVVDEYGSLQGVITQTDLLEAVAGDLRPQADESPDVVERSEGVLEMDGLMRAHEAFERLEIKPLEEGGFHTVAGFALTQFGRLPEPGEKFVYEGWRFEVTKMDGRRIAALLVTHEPEKPDEIED